ncbi:MAG TPA: hypothetical protein VI076_17100, partial [Actinopolymorphaceae bacterium]
MNRKMQRRHVLRLGGLVTVAGALGAQAAPALAGVRQNPVAGPTSAPDRADPTAPDGNLVGPTSDNLLANPGLEDV